MILTIIFSVFPVHSSSWRSEGERFCDDKILRGLIKDHVRSTKFSTLHLRKNFFYLRAYLKILQFSSSPMITMDDDWRIHASSSRTHASIAFPHARADGVLEDRRSSQVCYHSQPPDPRDQDCTVKVESMTMTRVLPSPGGRYALGISGVKDFDP